MNFKNVARNDWKLIEQFIFFISSCINCYIAYIKTPSKTD